MSSLAGSELEIELEGIVFSQVRRKSAVFKSVVEETKPAAGNQLGGDLVGEAKARAQNCVFCEFPSPLPNLLPIIKPDAIRGQQGVEAGGEVRGVRSRPEANTTGRTVGGPLGNELAWAPWCSNTRPKKSQRKPRFTVSLGVTFQSSLIVTAVVILSVVRQRDVGNEHALHALRVGPPTKSMPPTRRCRGRQQELRAYRCCRPAAHSGCRCRRRRSRTRHATTVAAGSRTSHAATRNPF